MSKDYTRRGAIGTLAALGAGVVTTGSAVGHGGSGEANGEFGVRGQRVRRDEITPEEVTVTVRKSSPDLKRRYGQEKATISKTETYPRPEPEADDLPMRDTQTVTEPWEATIATADEWRRAFDEGGASASTAGYSYREEYYDFGLFEYEKVDGLFERTAPMNLISPYSIGAITDVLTNNGYTTTVVQYNRHAYDSERDEFRTQDKSAATGTFGFLGRTHVKFWGFGGYVSASAHVDDAVPHEAVSFDDAEQEIENIFDDAAYWYGDEDYYDVDNGSFLDHDGAATGLF